MRVLFTKQAALDLDYWQRTDRRVHDRIRALLRDALAHPFTGIGKPEPLRWELAGCWSRRITGAHRLVYKVQSDALIVVQCRFHYRR